MSFFQIQNYNIYTASMQKSMQDKLFFINKIDMSSITDFVDFGCADGTLLKFLKDKLPDVHLVGYDNDRSMLTIAQQNNKDATFLADFSECLSKITPQTSILNLSSVLHEVYSYSSISEVLQFWKQIFAANFKYIVIRDFCYDNSISRETEKNDLQKVMKYGDIDQIKSFENFHGSLSWNKNLVHFLLKYRYIENWDREVRENYFPISLEALLDIIKKSEYEIVYSNHYTLPFTKDIVKKDFGIDIKDHTHIQLILKHS